MADQDSFINEVSEEVRRDRLYKLMKRYGWIAIALVVLIVAGAAIFEWQRAKAEAEAQATGDAILAALQEETPDARTKALAAFDPGESAEKAALVGLLQSASAAEAGDTVAARAALIDIVNNAEVPDVYRDLARLKAAILGEEAPADRMALLAPITAPGNPFRLLAIEQKALAEVELGELETARATLQSILSDADVTEGLRRRVGQLMVALGGSPDEN